MSDDTPRPSEPPAYISPFRCAESVVTARSANRETMILFIVFQDIYGLGYEKLGRLIVFNFAIQMFIDFITPKIIHKIGYRSAAFLCQFAACVGLCLMSILPRVMPNPYVAMFISIAVYATGSGLMEVILSPMIEMLPTSNKSGNMAVKHC